MIIFIATSITSFILGCLCRGCCHKENGSLQEQQIELCGTNCNHYQDRRDNLAPIYAEVVRKQTANDREDKFELDCKNNEAYGLSKRY